MNIQDQIDNAPEAFQGKYTNIGLLTIEFIRLTWQGKGNAPLREALTDGMPVESGKHSLEAVFEIDCVPVNPKGFVVKRKANIERSSGSRVTSWSEIVEPSLKTVFGNKWVTTASGKYVAMQDADNLENRRRDDGSLWSVPKFLETYPDLGAAQAADEALRSSNGPAGKISQELVSEAVALKGYGREKAEQLLLDTGRITTNMSDSQKDELFVQAGY